MANPKRPRDPNQRAKSLRNPYPRTPAMAAGIDDHIWTLTDIARLLD
jgi:hypothetical protein